jgi:hypothetical protein
VGWLKRATLTEYLLKQRDLENNSKPNRTRVIGSLPEKITTSRKEILTLSPGNVAEGSNDVSEDDDA